MLKPIEQLREELEQTLWHEPDHYSDVFDQDVLVRYIHYCQVYELMPNWGGKSKPGEETWGEIFDREDEELKKYGLNLEQSGGCYTYMYVYETKPMTTEEKLECIARGDDFRIWSIFSKKGKERPNRFLHKTDALRHCKEGQSVHPSTVNVGR